MATRSPIMEPIALATPIAHPDPANDNFASWTQDRRAARLLASCAITPPAGTWHETRYVQSRDLYFGYVGYRAEALNALYLEHGDRAMQHMHATGDSTAFDRWCREPNATDAITAALNASQEG